MPVLVITGDLPALDDRVPDVEDDSSAGETVWLWMDGR